MLLRSLELVFSLIAFSRIKYIRHAVSILAVKNICEKIYVLYFARSQFSRMYNDYPRYFKIRYLLWVYILDGDIMAIEYTLSIIKPDAVVKNVIGQIYTRFEQA